MTEKFENWFYSLPFWKRICLIAFANTLIALDFTIIPLSAVIIIDSTDPLFKVVFSLALLILGMIWIGVDPVLKSLLEVITNN